jgi:hypothetical protein
MNGNSSHYSFMSNMKHQHVNSIELTGHLLSVSPAVPAQRRGRLDIASYGTTTTLYATGECPSYKQGYVNKAKETRQR